jgi:hypothetical protein
LIKDSRAPKFEYDRHEKRRMLISIDVNNSNGKIGRIGNYEGDIIEHVARNFAVAFQLTEGAIDALISSLHEQVE